MRRSAGRGKFLEFRNEGAVAIKKLFRFVTAHPVFQLVQPLRIAFYIGHRYLMRTPEAFQLDGRLLLRELSIPSGFAIQSWASVDAQPFLTSGPLAGIS